MKNAAVTFLFLISFLAFGCPAAAQTQNSGEEDRYKVAAEYSANLRGLAVLVYKGDKIVFEEYQNGHSAEKPHLLASGTKSFAGVLAVMADEENLLKLDEKVSATITEWQTDERKSKITIRQLLSLTGGIGAGTIGRPPAYADAVNFPAKFDAGTTFEYGPAPFQIFGEVMRRKLALKNETVAGYMKRKILDPLEIKVAHWAMQNGEPNLPSGAYLTAREWLKFGVFLKNGGKSNGRQLVSKTLLNECLKGTKANPNYGLTFWLSPSNDGAANVAEGNGGGAGFGRISPTTEISKNGVGARIPRDMLMAAGAGKQRLYVIPSLDLVVVRQGQPSGFDDEEFLSLLLSGKNKTAK